MAFRRSHRRRIPAASIDDSAITVVDAALGFVARSAFISASDTARLLEAVHDELARTRPADAVMSVVDDALQSGPCRTAAPRRDVIDTLLDVRGALARSRTDRPGADQDDRGCSNGATAPHPGVHTGVPASPDVHPREPETR
jgi:hypothetical protein